MLLFEHQQSGADWLAKRARAILGDVPGLGKTRTLLAASKMRGVNDPLVFCPAMARTHWWREGSLLGMNPRVFSYDVVVRDGVPGMVEHFRVFPPKLLITDECHYLKHAEAQRTQLVLGKDGWARRIDTVWAASGTPVPRHPGEFWTILASLFPDVALAHGLRTPEDFAHRFLHMRAVYARGAYRQKVMGMKNDAEFREILAATMLRRTVDDTGLDVPEVFWSKWMLDPPTRGVLDSMDCAALEQLAAYKGALEDMASEPAVARMRRRLGEIKAEIIIPALCAEMDESNDKIVLFAHHTNVLRRLCEGMKRYGVAFIDGSITDTKRDAAWNRFQCDPECRVFVGQNVACQVSLTLTASRRVVIVEPDWAAYVNFQLGQRIARIGSGFQRCIGQLVSLAGTLDDGIVSQNLRETAMAQRMFT